jgi:hypothetical protein
MSREGCLRAKYTVKRLNRARQGCLSRGYESSLEDAE